MEPGVYYDIPAEDYFKIPAFSKSQIHATMKSARHLKHYLNNTYKSKAMIDGSLVDAILLEPEELGNYEVRPDTYESIIKGITAVKPWSGNATACKLKLKEIIGRGKTPITQKQLNEAQIMADSVTAHPAASKLLSTGKKQVVLVWIDDETKVLCKSRLDSLNVDSIDDLKTTKNAMAFKFAKDLVNLGYHCQAGSYLEGWGKLNQGEVLKWHLICVENVAPNCTVVYQLDEEAIEAGRIRYHIALRKYAQYLKDDPDFLQGYSNCIEPISIPSWEIELAFKEGNENDCGI